MARTEDQSRQITLEALSLTLGNYLGRVLFLVRGIGIAVLLQPELYGLWSLLKTFQDSTAFSGLGSSFALLREIPAKEAEGDPLASKRLTSTTLNLALIVSGVFALLILFASFTPLIPNIASELRISLVVLMLTTVTYYLPRQLQAERKFYVQAMFLFAFAALNAVFCLIAVYFWSLKEMLWGLALAHLLLLSAMAYFRHLRFSFDFDVNLAKKLVKEGLPIMIGAALFFFLRAADQLLIYALIGSSAAGFYALAGFVIMTINQIPVALAAALFPRMLDGQSEGQNREQIEHLFYKPLRILRFLVPFLLGGTYLCLEPLLSYCLADYLPALRATQISLLGLLFQAIWSISHSLLLAYDKQRQQMKAALIILIISTVMTVVVIQAGGQIEAVAWVSVVISLLAAITVLAYIGKLLDHPPSRWISILASLTWPLLYAIALVLWLDTISLFEAGTWQLLLNNFVKALLFCAAYSPLMWLAWKQIATLRQKSGYKQKGQ